MATVHDLTKENFDSFLEQHKLVVVAFILPFIPKTHDFLTELGATSTALASSNVRVAVVDCAKEDGFGPFNRWPSVKLFRASKDSKQYEGAWKASSMIAWTKRQLLPTVSELDVEMLSDFRRDKQTVLIGCFGSSHDQFHQTFVLVAEHLCEDYVFGLDSNGSIARVEHVDVPSILVFPKFDQTSTIIQPSMVIDDVSNRIKTACEPLVIEHRPETHRQLVDTRLPIAYALTDGSEDQDISLKTMLKPIAQEYRGRIIFGIVDTHVWNTLAIGLHLDQSMLPAFAIRDMQKGRFPLPQHQQLSTGRVNSFVTDFINGNLQPTIKSEPVPETQDGPVTVVVGDTYADAVINNDRDILLDYYTQSCGPCKAMYPRYEELARLYTSESMISRRVTIAKVDAEANDVPGDIRGFPTFKLFPARCKESPIDYDGPWTVDGFVKFIEENGSY